MNASLSSNPGQYESTTGKALFGLARLDVIVVDVALAASRG